MHIVPKKKEPLTRFDSQYTERISEARRNSVGSPEILRNDCSSIQREELVPNMVPFVRKEGATDEFEDLEVEPTTFPSEDEDFYPYRSQNRKIKKKSR